MLNDLATISVFGDLKKIFHLPRGKQRDVRHKPIEISGECLTPVTSKERPLWDPSLFLSRLVPHSTCWIWIFVLQMVKHCLLFLSSSVCMFHSPTCVNDVLQFLLLACPSSFQVTSCRGACEAQALARRHLNPL